ncbi:MAG TPA: prolipoprotein diacylglyceryl transferase [Verrucomicrobiales bacterium]|nr:prolipoprotein diacylglyceryl transferase [Verrucomicrobiales bacterium]
MHPVAFELGSLTIYWYGVLVGIGCLTGLWAASKRGLLEGVHPDRVYDIAWWVLLGTVVGARGMYVLSYWNQDFAGRPWYTLFNIRQGGLVFYGGFLGASAGVLLYAWTRRAPLWQLADILSPSIALGSFFGRLGCLMTGCCYGRACTLPWGIEFPEGHAAHGMRVHPTQIYDSLLNLAVYGVLEWAFRRKRFDGQIFAAWLIIYPMTRSFTELFRGDYPADQLRAGGFTPAQTLSVGILVTGVALYRWLPRRLAGRPGTATAASAQSP